MLEGKNEERRRKVKDGRKQVLRRKKERKERYPHHERVSLLEEKIADSASDQTSSLLFNEHLRKILPAAAEGTSNGEYIQSAI